MDDETRRKGLFLVALLHFIFHIANNLSREMINAVIFANVPRDIAVNSLMDQRWREKLLEAVLMRFYDDLELLDGHDPPPPLSPPFKRQNRSYKGYYFLEYTLQPSFFLFTISVLLALLIVKASSGIKSEFIGS